MIINSKKLYIEMPYLIKWTTIHTGKLISIIGTEWKMPLMMIELEGIDIFKMEGGTNGEMTLRPIIGGRATMAGDMRINTIHRELCIAGIGVTVEWAMGINMILLRTIGMIVAMVGVALTNLITETIG